MPRSGSRHHSNRETCAPRSPVELRRFEDDLGPEGSFHDGKREHRVPCERKSPFFPESLEHFLENRKTGHDVVDVGHGFELEASPLTRTTRFSLGGALGDRPVPPHLRQVPLPQAGTCELEDASRADLENELGQGAAHGSRVGSFPAQAKRLFEELLIKHKICTLTNSSISNSSNDLPST